MKSNLPSLSTQYGQTATSVSFPLVSYMAQGVVWDLPPGPGQAEMSRRSHEG